MIHIKQANFAYNHHIKLIDHLDLKLNTGDIVGLLGKNGAGKTTLLRLISGLLYPKSGSVTINGTESAKREAKVLNELFFITEEFYIPHISIQHYLEANAPLYSNFSHKLFDEVLSEFELKRSLKLHMLSHGQKKKFFVAFGLATNARLLLLDEPTNGLDIPSKKQFRQVVANYFTNDKLIIVSTHQVKDVESLVDHLLVLDNGKILFHHSTSETTDKLAFKRNVESTVKALYCEELIGSNNCIMPNNNNEATHIDLELLFNAIISDAVKINQVFNKGGNN